MAEEEVQTQKATLYAFTDISAGEGGKVSNFAAGDVVTGLSQKLVKQLIESGAITRYNRLDVEAAGAPVGDTEREELEAANAALQARIDELEAAGDKTPPAPPTPSTDKK